MLPFASVLYICIVCDARFSLVVCGKTGAITILNQVPIFKNR